MPKSEVDILREAESIIQDQRVYCFEYMIPFRNTAIKHAGVVKAASESDAYREVIKNRENDPNIDYAGITIRYAGVWKDLQKDLDRRFQGD